RQGEDGYNREAGILTQHPDGITKILPECLHGSDLSCATFSPRQLRPRRAAAKVLRRPELAPVSRAHKSLMRVNLGAVQVPGGEWCKYRQISQLRGRVRGFRMPNARLWEEPMRKRTAFSRPLTFPIPQSAREQFRTGRRPRRNRLPRRWARS